MIHTLLTLPAKWRTFPPIAVGWLLTLAIAGCCSCTRDHSPSPAQPAPPPVKNSSNSPPAPTDGYTGPPVTVQVAHTGGTPAVSTALVEVTVPTGGWTLALDNTQITDSVAKLYFTLERPGAGEFVTQALVTLKDRYASEKPTFSKAEVYIHLAERGISTLTTNYRLAASSK